MRNIKTGPSDFQILCHTTMRCIFSWPRLFRHYWNSEAAGGNSQVARVFARVH